MSEPIKSVTWLYRLAIEWYKDNPDQQIPLEIWKQHVQVSKNNEEMRVIYFGTQAVKKFDYNMIPALAAIALNTPSHQLLKVVKHHKITVDEVDYVSFPWCFENTLPPEPGDDQLLIPGEWLVSKAFVDAMSLDDDLTNKLEDHLKIFHNEYVFDVARLLTHKPRLWLNTHLSEHFDLQRAGKAEGIPYPRLVCAEALKEAGLDFNELSDEQVLCILERSGNLLPDVDAENAFTPEETVGFFEKIFCETARPSNFKRIIQAMNRVENPVLIKTIADRIQAVIPDHYKLEPWDGAELLEVMRRELDPTRYGHIFESMVLKLCTLPIQNMAGVKNNEYIQVVDVSEREFFESGDKILMRLNDELKYLAPHAWRKRHFEAIGKLIAEWDVPQDLTDVDLQHLLVLTVTALDAYKAAGHLDYLGNRLTWCENVAEKHVGKLVEFVSKTIDIDYGHLSRLPSGAKALLVSCGLDLRKLPGINNRDKGALLSESLGL
jgi:hypothetical protein